MPLVGFEKVAAALKHMQPAKQLLELHTYTLLQGPDQVWYFDFLPLRPTHPATAALLLSASAAPGELRVRKLETRAVRVSSSVRLLGSCLHDDPLQLAADYNRAFNTQLHLLHNNCSHHTEGLTCLLLTPQHS